MHVFGDLIPLDGNTRSVRAEYRVRRIFKVGLGVVVDAVEHRLRIVAGPVPCGHGREPAPAGGVGRKLGGIAVELGNRRKPVYDTAALGLKFAAHGSDIAYGTAYLLRRHLERELIPRLKQHAFGLHKPLTHRTAGGLSEVAALGVLDMRPAGDEPDANIGYGRACEHALVFL